MDYNVIKFEEINSTSVWARKNLERLNDFDVVSTEFQTEGHGQFERKWFSSSSNGGNLYISLVLKPSKLSHLNELTRFTSYIGAKTVEEYGIEAKFKFPNDILIDGKKIAGILAESVFIGERFKGVVVGVGINLNLTAEDVLNIDIPATSIFIETGKQVDKEEFLTKFLENFKKEYDEFLECGLQGAQTRILKV